ncbi:hypothetical protein BJ508DRAFT_68501 [Ascobolus immersus RN42]|uniref:Uncharacterized protein n=1 Tax=Ascobolus immersus RN42 TaxID=1160509 RepID=A0A3N4HET6_ASCIM|nr:hypothetical protein BJ508DRAFT_68501 [Ascobolus immersus RN42]
MVIGEPFGADGRSCWKYPRSREWALRPSQPLVIRKVEVMIGEPAGGIDGTVLYGSKYLVMIGRGPRLELYFFACFALAALYLTL